MGPLRRDRQIVSQDPLAAPDPRMTIGEAIGEPLDTFLPALPKAERKARVQEMMAKVGKPADGEPRYPHEFFGGASGSASRAP